MSKFAKVFDVEDTQVLAVVEREGEDNDNALTVVMTTEVHNVRMKATLGYETDEQVNEAFQKIDQELADSFYKDCLAMFP